ncbi:aspartyl protease family protein [Saprospiraceae bacterium]|nr:aspartyl protease family protein [Saprospiraceae bacterium]
MHKQKLYLYLSILISLAISPTCEAQVLGLELLDDKESITIPFEYKQGFLSLDIRMANLPLNFLFDTGAEHTILFKKEISDILGFKYEEPLKIAGADLHRIITAYITRGIPLQLDNTISVDRDIIVLEEDFLYFDQITGESIDGILGARFFRGLIVEIDYKKKIIVLYKSLPKKVLKSKYVKLNSSFLKHKPYVNCTIENNGDTISAEILIDTGAAVPFLLFLSEESKMSLPENYIVGNLGRGLGGDIVGYMGKTDNYSLHKQFVFNDLITSYQLYEPDTLNNIVVARDGLIGNPLLERFNIVIDYVREEVYVKPNKRFNKPIEYDISGLVLYAFGNDLSGYFVKEVLPGSPAEQAGIQTGDIIKKMGFFSTNFYTLEQIYKRLVKRKGKKVNMVIERKGEKLKKTLILTDNL